jgi:hypothetical protein
MHIAPTPTPSAPAIRRAAATTPGYAGPQASNSTTRRTPLDRGSDGPGRRNQQDPGRFSIGDEILKVDAHGSQIAGHKNPIIIGCDLQNFGIEGALPNCTRSRSKIYRRLSSKQPFPNVGINVGISLKANSQANRDGASFFARSKRSIIS